MCGGTSFLRLVKQQVEGLSPRVRGNPGKDHVVGFELRSIPACAGEPGAVYVRRDPR